MSLSRLGTVGSTLNIVREIDLAALKQEAERPLSLLVLGAGELPHRLAEALSATPGQRGIHPWLAVETLPLTAVPAGYALALLVVAEPELDEAARDALSRVSSAGIPLLTIVVGPDGAQRVGATVPRAGEVGRIALRELSPELLRHRAVPAILAALPTEQHLALARQFALFRPAVIGDLVESTSRANAIYAASTSLGQLIPGLNIPFVAADVIVLTKNQFTMAYKIALAAGKTGDPRSVMGEIVSVVGGGLIFRQIARELVGLIPVAGAIPKIAVAYAGTRVIGTTVNAWANENVRLSRDEMRSLYDEAIARGRAVASRLRREEHAALPPPVDEEESPSLWQRVRNRLPF